MRQTSEGEGGWGGRDGAGGQEGRGAGGAGDGCVASTMKLY